MSHSDTIQVLLTALKAAKVHLDYINYGDKWERQYAEAEGLEGLIEEAIRQGEVGG